MRTETKKKFLTDIAFFSVAMFVFYLTLKYVLVWLLPFLFGFLIAYIAETVSKRMCEKTRISKKAASVAVVLVIFTLISVILIVIFDKLAATVDRYAEMMPNFYTNSVLPLLESGKDFFNNIILKVAPKYRIDTTSITSFVDNNAGELIGTVSGQFIDFLVAILKNVPKIFLGLGFTVFSSIFFVLDYQNIVVFIHKQLPEKVKTVFAKTKSIMIKSVLKSIKAYMLIFLITFVELTIGLFVLKVENAVSKALIISFVDFLPLLGLAVGFIPWIVLCLVKKDFYLAIGLSVLFLAVAVVRSFIEPRIVGKQIGLNPIVSLLCFYFGIKFFGIIGAFVLPIAVIILNKLNEEGTLKLWKL